MDGTRKGPAGEPKWRLWLFVGALVVTVGAGALLYHRHATAIVATRERGEGQISDLFELLTDRGYVPNGSLSGALVPGTILQTHEAGTGGADRAIDPPVTMFWGDRCYPDAKARDGSFALPDRSGDSRSSISLGADGVRKMFPALALEHSAAVDFGIRISGPRLRVLAKGDISGRMAPDCVKGLREELAANAKAEWFSVVLETVTAAQLSFHVTWSTNATARERLEAQAEVASILARATKSADGGIASATLVQQGRDETALEIADVTLGYRMRHLEPIWISPVAKTTPNSQTTKRRAP